MFKEIARIGKSNTRGCRVCKNRQSCYKEMQGVPGNCKDRQRY